MSRTENPVAYQNKDIVSKFFSDKFPKESLEVYGVHLPKIKRVLPTDLPEVVANELRIDKIFELEDGSYAIIDYESTYQAEHKIKYLEYIVRILRRYIRVKNIRIHMIVLYTADVQRKSTQELLDIGAVKLFIEPAFLSEMNSEEIKSRLTGKILANEPLTNKELMEFVVLPLTYAGEEKKQQVIQELFQTVKGMENADEQNFILAGMIVFADKIIDEATAKQVRGWLRLTKVGRLIELEKEEALAKKEQEVTKKVTKEVTKEVTNSVVITMLKDKVLSMDKIAAYANVSIETVKKLAIENHID